MLRFLTAGESHGRALVVIVEGLPAGLPVEASDIAFELARRRLGFGRGPRMRFEADEITLVGGIRHGRTLGSPVAVEIANTEWPKWTEEMSPEPGAPSNVLTQPRPGHADLPGMLKYGFEDARDVLERASARETAARVAAGTLAKLLLTQLGVSLVSHIVALGDATTTPESLRPGPSDLDKVDESAVRCFDPVAEEAMIAAVKAAAKEGDSLGGVAEVLAYGVPVGLGSHVHWDRKLDANLAQALMSIQAVKAVEIGDGWDNAARRGSEAHDAIFFDPDGGLRAAHRPSRRDRGRHLQRRPPRGARRHEAAGHAEPARPPDRRRRHEGVDGQLPRAHRCHGRARDGRRRRVDDGARAGHRGAAQVRRRLARRSRAQPRRVRRLARDDAVVRRRQPERGSGQRGKVTPRILLVGMMGAGKTTTGHLVADRLGWGYRDSDADVEAATGLTVPELFARDGEAAFRQAEADVLADACADPAASVVSVAGGAVLRPDNRRLIAASGTVVWLRARPETLAARVGDGAGRPLLADDPGEAMVRLNAVRSPLYAEVADLVIDVDELPAEEVARRILAAADAPDDDVAAAETGAE